MMSQDIILDVISKSLILHIPNEFQIIECFLCTSGKKPIDDLLNSLKSIALECLNWLLEYIQIYPRKIPRNPEVNKFYGFMRSRGAKYILDSVQNFCVKTEDLDDTLDVKRSLKLFNKVLGKYSITKLSS